MGVSNLFKCGDIEQELCPKSNRGTEEPCWIRPQSQLLHTSKHLSTLGALKITRYLFPVATLRHQAFRDRLPLKSGCCSRLAYLVTCESLLFRNWTLPCIFIRFLNLLLVQIQMLIGYAFSSRVLIKLT